METPTLQNRVKELQSQVAPYAKGKKFAPELIPFSFDGAISSHKTYIGILIGIFVLLLVFRPSFILDEKPDKKGTVSQYLSFKRLIQFWLIISTILIVGLYTYNYKTKKE